MPAEQVGNRNQEGQSHEGSGVERVEVAAAVPYPIETAHLCLLALFLETISLRNSPGCSRSCFVDQAGLELTETSLLLPPKCWD